METKDIDIDLLNSKIVDSLRYGEDTCKVAAETVSNYIRMILREEMFNDKIIPIQTVAPEDLGEDERDKPFRWVTLEPASPAAVVLPQDGAADVVPYFARKAKIMYFRVSTPKYRKDVTELMTYKHIDLRKVMMDIGINELGKRRDFAWVQLSDAAADVGGNISFAGGIDRSTLAELSKVMTRRSLEPTLGLINKTTFMEVLKGTRNEIGGDLAEKMYVEGFEGIPQKLMGIQYATTIKSDIVHDNVVYIYTAPDYLGVNEELQPETMYIKRVDNSITMYATSTIGMGILNTNGVVKGQFFKGNSQFANTRYPLETVNNSGTAL